MLIFFRKESLARTRRRIKRSLRESALKLIYRNILHEGVHGHERDRSIYNV